jgi:hypothetical protein
MEKFDIDFLTKSYLKGKVSVTDTIKMMLYKRDETIFDKINFEDDKIYDEPLIFAFLNDDKQYNLDWLLIGYMNTKEERKVSVKSDNFGRIYIANIGWLITSIKNCDFDLIRGCDGKFSLFRENQKISFYIEPIESSIDGKIEILSHSIPLLRKCFYDTNGKLLDIEVDEINKRCHSHLLEAITLMKELIPDHYI